MHFQGNVVELVLRPSRLKDLRHGAEGCSRLPVTCRLGDIT